MVAGGVEPMSNVAFYTTEMRWGVKGSGVTLHDGLARGRVTAGGRDYPVPGGMPETAENLRREYNISRTEQDELWPHRPAAQRRQDPHQARLAARPADVHLRKQSADPT